ncbi:MAG: 30S ribosomal protein S19e [Fervidicoccaceae archaeon]
MTTAMEVPADLLIARLAEYLKRNFEEIRPPHWASYVKTGTNRERPPLQEDWWYIRAASILRKLYKSREPVGLETFRVVYGGAKRYGSSPRHFAKASGSVLRKVLQQLEKAGLVARVPGKGRTLTPKAQSLLDGLAHEILRELAESRPELRKYLE